MTGRTTTDTAPFPWQDHAHEAKRATFDPDDAKLRVYTDFVPREMYDAFRKAGFGRAPKQECFFAVWSPEREDIVLALVPEIEDEDTTLLERAEMRHLRFATYSANAARRAELAIAAGAAAMDGIVPGQPVLVNHHSERKHRKDVERAQRAADQSVEEVNRRDYWKTRAQGVLRHAGRKYDPGVVMRRIKTLEADLRKHDREGTRLEAERQQLARLPEKGRWQLGHTSWVVSDFVRDVLGRDKLSLLSQILPTLTPEEEQAIRDHLAQVDLQAREYHARWIEHIGGQIEYWKAILGDQGETRLAEQWPLQKGCWVANKREALDRGGLAWAQVARVNRGADKQITTVTIDRPTIVGGYKGSSVRIWSYTHLAAWKTDAEWQALSYAERIALTQPAVVTQPRPVVTAGPSQPDPLRQAAQALDEQTDAIEVQVNHNPNYYPTPPHVVQAMIDRAGLDRFSEGESVQVLEPSAGDGRIIRAIHERFPWVDCRYCEIDWDAGRVLQQLPGRVVRIGHDFLDLEGWDGEFDRVIGNPPWNNRAYVAHTKLAYQKLKPGGRLVWLLPNFPFWQADPARDSFRAWLDDVGACDELLPAGTFTVGARLVIIDKPA